MFLGLLIAAKIVMTTEQMWKAAFGVAASALVLFWMVYRGQQLAAKQKAAAKLKAENAAKLLAEEAAMAASVVDHVTQESMQGLWRMISLGRNGNFAPQEHLDKMNFAIAIVSNTMTITNSLEMSTFELNNTVVPNQLDQFADDGDKHLCIVRFRDGKLEMCQGEAGKPRPVDFNRKRKDGASLTLFERVEMAENGEE